MSVQVRAIDNGSPPRFTDHSLTVNIVDVNDNAPVIQSPRGYNVSVSEVSVTRPANQTTSEPRTRKYMYICICICIWFMYMVYIAESWDKDNIYFVIFTG